MESCVRWRDLFPHYVLVSREQFIPLQEEIVLFRKTIFGVAWLWAASAWAGPIVITNPSFEDPALGSGGILNGIATGWTLQDGNAGTWNPTASYFNSVPDPNQILFVGDGFASDAYQ